MTEESQTKERGWKRIDIAVAAVVILFAVFLIGREWLATPGGQAAPQGANQTASTAALPAEFQAHTKEGLRHYFETRDFQKAEAEFRASLEYAPNEALGYSNLGSALMEQGKWQDAIPVLEKAVAINPRLQIARNNLAWAISERAKHQK
jgi:tetratricopeptide (TPR) repeat protein